MEVQKKKAGAKWTQEEEKTLKRLARSNLPARTIALKLGRTENAVRSKATQMEIAFKGDK